MLLRRIVLSASVSLLAATGAATAGERPFAPASIGNSAVRSVSLPAASDDETDARLGGGEDFYDAVLLSDDSPEPWVAGAPTEPISVPAAPQELPAAPNYAPACDPSMPFTQPTNPWMNDPAMGTNSPSMSATNPSFAAASDPGLLGSQERVAAYLGEAGYIDLAVPFTNVRFRYDAAYDSNFMTRAEFTNATCGSPGAPLPETNYDAQYFALYYEQLLTPRFSMFAEMPFLLLDPEVNANTGGLYDMNFGAKYAFVARPDEYFTFQMRVYAPTGDASRGLSTGHASLEPALLYTRRFTERLTLLSELRYWIPIDGSTQLGNQSAAGNVLRYGVGLGYAVVDRPDLRVTPIAELVGWHVFDGLKFNANTGFLSADNDAIVNFKIGVRVTDFDTPLGNAGSLYVGYGTALTDERWYQNLFRIEYRVSF